MNKTIYFGADPQMLENEGSIAGDDNGNLTNFLAMLLKKNIDHEPDPGDGAAKKTEERQGLS